MLILALIVSLSYLLGSIPNAILITRYVKGLDIRDHGSGNAGGTNVFRVVGWKWGVTVILLDTLKGLIAVLLVSQLYFISKPDVNNPTFFTDYTLIQIIAGLSAVIGHIWSIFANFRGGKGIATALGMLLAVSTVDMLMGIGVFILVVAVSRYVSLGSIIGAVTVPLMLMIRENVFGAEVQGYNTLLPFTFGIFILIIYTHRKNITRILQGSESKISFKKKNSEE